MNQDRPVFAMLSKTLSGWPVQSLEAHLCYHHQQRNTCLKAELCEPNQIPRLAFALLNGFAQVVEHSELWNMDKILGQIGGMPNMASRNDDDFSDRLNHRFTTCILVAFAIIVSTSQYVGDPINCWVPAHFKDDHVAYTNNYCWVRNTYYLSFDEYIPKEHENDKRRMIPYYQWMPIILLLQALFFHLPITVWRTLNRKSGVDVNYIVEAGEGFEDIEKTEEQDHILASMTQHLDR